METKLSNLWTPLSWWANRSNAHREYYCIKYISSERAFGSLTTLEITGIFEIEFS